MDESTRMEVNWRMNFGWINENFKELKLKNFIIYTDYRLQRVLEWKKVENELCMSGLELKWNEVENEFWMNQW